MSAQPDLNALPVVLAVARTGGFTAAAELLGISKAKVSVAVARMERQVGAGLFVRTTRRVSLTEAGRALVERCDAPLARILDGLAELHRGQPSLTGTLRLACTPDHLAYGLAGSVGAFLARHPGVRIDLFAADRVVHPVEAGIDLSIRLGWLRDSSQRAVRLGRFAQWVVASPRWLASVGAEPTRPEQLATVDWVALTLLDAPLTWSFTAHDGSQATVRMRSRLRVDSAAALRTLIEAGAGVGVVDAIGAADPLRAGRLVRLLSDWRLPDGGIHAVYPPGRAITPLARAFVAFLRERTADAPGTR